VRAASVTADAVTAAARYPAPRPERSTSTGTDGSVQASNFVAAVPSIPAPV